MFHFSKGRKGGSLSFLLRIPHGGNFPFLRCSLLLLPCLKIDNRDTVVAPPRRRRQVVFFPFLLYQALIFERENRRGGNGSACARARNSSLFSFHPGGGEAILFLLLSNTLHLSPLLSMLGEKQQHEGGEEEGNAVTTLKGKKVFPRPLFPLCSQCCSSSNNHVLCKGRREEGPNDAPPPRFTLEVSMCGPTQPRGEGSPPQLGQSASEKKRRESCSSSEPRNSLRAKSGCFFKKRA